MPDFDYEYQCLFIMDFKHGCGKSSIFVVNAIDFIILPQHQHNVSRGYFIQIFAIKNHKLLENKNAGKLQNI